jgi:hypothetical protein
MTGALVESTRWRTPAPAIIGSSGGEASLKPLSLNFTEITETYTGHDPGISGSPETVGYDLSQMKTV